jgi:hypothetical protein
MSVLVAVGRAAVAVVRVDTVAFASLAAFGMSGLGKCVGIGVALERDWGLEGAAVVAGKSASVVLRVPDGPDGALRA